MLVFFVSMKGIMVKIQSINNTAIKSSTVGITVRFTLKNQNADLFISVRRTLAEWNCCGHPGTQLLIVFATEKTATADSKVLWMFQRAVCQSVSVSRTFLRIRR